MDTSITHIRPRFKINVQEDEQVILNRISHMLDEGRPGIRGVVLDNHVILDIVDDEVHYWSPQVNFRVEASDNDKVESIVSGLIGPRPAVWTMFMFIYFTIGIIGFVIFSFGVSNWMLGQYSPMVWSLPITIVFMLTAHRAGKYGERLGSEQVEVQKNFIREAVGLPLSRIK